MTSALWRWISEDPVRTGIIVASIIVSIIRIKYPDSTVRPKWVLVILSVLDILALNIWKPVNKATKELDAEMQTPEVKELTAALVDAKKEASK